MPRLVRGPLIGECRSFTGKPIRYQEEAAEELYHRGARILPHMWVNTSCGTEFCLEHIEATQPKSISYPAGACVYCGLLAPTQDHLIPRTLSGDRMRRFVATVPACTECNSTISDRASYRITERRELAHRHIRRKYASALRTVPHTKAQLDELGPTLRAYVKNQLGLKAVTEGRLAWPTDPDYDLRAFQHSGIEDPYLLGLI